MAYTSMTSAKRKHASLKSKSKGPRHQAFSSQSFAGLTGDELFEALDPDFVQETEAPEADWQQ